MARRAKYGHAVRVSQDLGGTLIAIARQMEAQEDSNIMDAWKNGGMFQGRKVTDEMVASYWQKRESGLDPRDPTYDSVKDQIMQLQYGIAQSKADLEHVQNKISDTQYAQFFLGWAKKTPKDGEFWRVLQKDAAQLLESAKQKAAANADKVKVEAFNKFTAARQGDIDLGNALTDAINQMAKASGLNIDENGDELLRMLSNEYKTSPDKYHRLEDALKASGRSFSGAFTHGFVAASINNSEQAYDQIAVRAKKDGYADAYNGATKGQTDMATAATDLKTWSVAQAYDRGYAAYSRIWDDPTASYADKNAAAARFAGVVGQLAGTTGLSTATVAMLKGDAARLSGADGGETPSFGTSLGHTGIDNKVAGQVATTSASEALLAQNPGAFVRASLKPDGTFDATGQGPVGVIASGALPPDVTFVAQPGLMGTPAMVAVQPHTVYATDPNDPNKPKAAVGKVVTYGNTTLWQYADSNGQTHWIARNPFADGASATRNDDGSITVTPGASSVDPISKAAQMDGDPAYAGMGLQDKISAVAQQGGSGSWSKDIYSPGVDGKNGQLVSKRTVTYKDGQITVTDAAYNRDPVTGQVTTGDATTVPVQYYTGSSLTQSVVAPSLLQGGDHIPGSFSSVAQASMVVAGTAGMSPGQVAALAQDPAFQHAFAQQTMASYGTTNPLDPRVIKAWTDATYSAQFAGGVVGLGTGDRTPNGRTVDRADLNLPGTSKDTSKSNISITFGGQQINLPNAPSFLQDPTLAAGIAGNYNKQGPGGNGLAFQQQVLQPGQVPGITPTSSGTGASAGNATPTSFGTVTPLTTPKPGNTTPTNLGGSTPLTSPEPIFGAPGGKGPGKQ